MNPPHSLFNSLQTFDPGDGQSGRFYSLSALESAGLGTIRRLPVSIRLVRPGEFEARLKAADSIRVAPSPRLTSEIRALAGEDSVQYVFE